MISKQKQELARMLNMSEKTFREWEKLSDNLLEFERNIGVELSDKFRKSVDIVEHNKKIMVTNSDLGKVVTLPLNKQIEIAERFINNPTKMKEIWKEYFPQKTKITIEVSENINKLLTQQAKDKNISKKEYTSQMITLLSRCIDQDK